jgi:OmpA-OmpF porin, OOP family
MLMPRWPGGALFAAASLTFAGSGAWGAELGWYYGLSAGQSHADLSQSELDSLANAIISTAGPPLTSSSTLDQSDKLWSIFFGYQFSQHFAFEAGYLNLGSFPYQYTGTVDLGGTTGAASSSFNETFESTGYPVSVIGALPIGLMFDVHGRAGILFTNSEEKVFATAGNASISPTFAASSTDFFYGAGAALNLGDTWSISIDWVLYDKVGDGDVVAETSFDAISLSLLYRIGPF